MGIAVALVMLGYATFGIVIFSLARAFIKNKLFVFMVGFSLLWPIWAPLGSNFIFKELCSYGEGGFRVEEPYRLTSLSIDRRPDLVSSYNYRVKNWNGSYAFINYCAENHCSQLDDLFSSHNPWSEIRNREVQLEEKWYFEKIRGEESRRLAAGRFWLDKTGGHKCLTPLKGYEKSVCIAGERIGDLRSEFSVVIDPFTRKDRMNPQWLFATSVEWDYFSIAKHQHHLVKNNKIVARYIWYEWHYLPFFGMKDSCPRQGIAQDEYFWNKILSNAPLSILLKQ